MVKVNPLGVTMSCRDIKICEFWLEQIDFIDRLLIKNYLHGNAHRIANKFFTEHSEYTHYLLLNEDVIHTPSMVKRIIQDVVEKDFPVVCGYCNWDWKRGIVNLSNTDLRKCRLHSWQNYKFIKKDDILRGKLSYPFAKVFHQGLTMTMIRRDVFLKHPIRKYTVFRTPYVRKVFKLRDGKEGMFDTQMSIDMANARIPIVVDLRLMEMHMGDTIFMIDFTHKPRFVKFYSKQGHARIIRQDKPFAEKFPSRMLGVRRPTQRARFNRKQFHEKFIRRKTT